MLIKRPAPKALTVERPIFLVSAPCAGVSPIFELFSRARRVGTLKSSARDELRTRLEANDITAGQIQALVRNGLPEQGRWLSAIVANARQIPLLNEAYPDALFIYVHRNAQEQLARMMLDGHSESDWSETTSRIMNDLAALPARRWCAIDIDQFLANRPHEAALLGRFAEIAWRVRPGPAQRARRRPDAAKAASVVPELARDAAIFAQANHASLHDLPEKKFWKTLPENVAKAVVSSRLAAGLTVGAAATIPVAANAATLTVTNTNDTGSPGDGSLRGEINAAQPGDTITFDPSLNGQTITITAGSHIGISGPVTIQGPGSALLTIDGGGTAADGGLTGGQPIFYLYAHTPGVDGGPATPETVTISGLTLQHGNATGNGGAISAQNCNVVLSDVIIQDNQAASHGGGLFAQAGNSISIQNSVITGNTAAAGGGFFLYRTYGNFVFDQVQVTNNTSTGPGGGGGLRYAGNVTIEDSTISGNVANRPDAGSAYGGGLAVSAESTVTLLNSTVSGNNAGSGGGGFSLYGDSTGLVQNSTFAGNTSTYLGGAFSLYSSGALLAETTISGNITRAGGGGLYTGGQGGGFVMTNSIVAGNFNTLDGGFPDDVITNGVGAVQSTYSLIQTPGTAIFADSDGGVGDAGQVVGTGNIVNEDPLLGALADNGGTTKTMLPGAGSPVINKGDPNFPGDFPAILSDAGLTAPTTDQRGDTRVFGGRIDMGSVEVQNSPASPDAGSTSSTDAGGTVQTSDAGPKSSTTGKGCNCNGTSDAALALLTPIGLLLMRKRRRSAV